MPMDIFSVQRRALNVTTEHVWELVVGTGVHHCQDPGGLEVLGFHELKEVRTFFNSGNRLGQGMLKNNVPLKLIIP